MVMDNGMFEGVKSRTTGNDIDPALRYWGPSSPELVVLDGYKEASSSMIKSPSFSFTKLSSAPMPEAIDYSIDLTKSGPWVIYASANKKTAFPEEDFRKYGLAHSDDESMLRMDGWIGSTVGPHAIEYVKSNPEIGLFELPEHIPSYSKHSAMTDTRVPLKELAGTVPINMVGFYVSKLANAWEHSMGLIFYDYPKVPRHNDETLALLERLDAGREIIALGIENMKNPSAKLYYDNGTSVLVEAKDIYEKAAAIAQARGLYGKAGVSKEAIDEVIQYFLKHELVHNSDYRKFTTTRKKEIYVGEVLAELFSERASIVNEKLARYYRALAKESKAYANSYRRISSSARARIEYLAEKYASEARARGMDEEEVADYVANKLEEEIEKAEKSELEETIESEESGEAEKDNAKPIENEEYSEKEMSTDEDVQEQEDTDTEETTEESAEEG